MDKNKRKMGLGRGLGMLMGNQNASQETENVAEETLVAETSNEISLDDIEINPFQPRTNFDPVALNELKDSITTQGIIQPITVRKLGENKFQLVSGERRLQASRLAGLKQIPAYVIEATDNQMLEMGLIENIQRENLNPLEVALAYQRLISECNLKQEELGKRVGKDRSTVNNFLRLLNLPKSIQDGLQEKKLSMGHARALLALTDVEQMENAYKLIIQNDLSVRKVEDLVKNMLNADLTKPSKTAKPKETKHVLVDVQDKLSRIFNKKITVMSDSKVKGEIKISFANRAEYEDILLKLKK